jgi:Holliday junction DNA helicase RuvA
MIAYLKGKLAHKDTNHVVVECNGVGYWVRISLNTYASLSNGEEAVKLYTHLAIREDAHELYGFAEMAEKTMFLQLIGIQGVGGNTALTILSSIPLSELHQVIETGDLNRLKGVKGIGAKTAGRILLELKGKLVLDGEAGEASPLDRNREEAISALVALGLPKSVIEKRIDGIIRSSNGPLSVEQLIREGLKAT